MKAALQKFGRTLSAIVMPNIGAFIAWGFVTALFIPGGWLPNEKLARLAPPMMRWLLPLLIAYTAGNNICGIRGGVAGAIATMGVIVGSDVPMFIGAMIMGPLGGWCIKKFDGAVHGKVRAGLEMLADNFSLGIIALLLSLAGYLFIGGAVGWFTDMLKVAVEWLIARRLLPLVSILVEPGKVLFLNNAINHGICDVLGVQQVQEAGRSIIFLIEANPGAGLGILMACWIFGKGVTKASAPGAVIIHFLGGIHEIYFPYVLAQPALVASTICGSAAALLFYTITGTGLVAPASPGSIIALLVMAPKGQTLLVLAGVLIAAAVSFMVAVPIVKLAKVQEDESAPEPNSDGRIRKVVFACDAGMGSSALGATRFRSRLMKAGYAGDVVCTNSTVDSIPADASVVVVQRALADRAKASGKEVMALNNFLVDQVLDTLLEKIRIQHEQPMSRKVLEAGNILVGLSPESKEGAILRAAKLLAEGGYIKDGYAAAMLERETMTSTYMGQDLAIPHGGAAASESVLSSGIVVLQYPDGIDWDGERVRLVIAIAGKGGEHLDILAAVASSLEDEALLEKLCTTEDPQEIFEAIKA